MTKLAIGIMSGTLQDGVSVTLSSFDRGKIKIIGYRNFFYPDSLLHAISAARRISVREVSRLNISLGNYFADCVLKLLKASKVNSRKVAVIGSHGHTVYHGPKDHPQNTLQIGEPCVIAERTGIT